MVKDRARPFSRKHARYWMTAAGGMVLIMVVNTILGFWIYRSDSPTKRKPDYHPIPPYSFDAGVDAPAAAAPDGGASAAPDAGQADAARR